MITVLGICGSLHWPSHTHVLLDIALGAAREQGARVELLDLRETSLPLFDPRQRVFPPNVTEMRERFTDAHAYIIGTPDYYGGMSGALKNLFDYLSDELAGKLLSFVVASGRDQGSTVINHLRDIAIYHRAWTLPAAVSAQDDDFDQQGNLVASGVRERLISLGRQATVYGELLFNQLARDRETGGDAKRFAA